MLEATLRSRIATDVVNGKRSADSADRSVRSLGLYGKLGTLKILTDMKSVDDVAREIIES
jgi:hypothetical protein